MDKHRKNNLVWKLGDNEFIEILKKTTVLKEIAYELGFSQKPGARSREQIRNRARALGFKLDQKIFISKTEKKIPPQSKKRSQPRKCSCGVKIGSGNKSGLCINCLRRRNSDEKINIWKLTGYTGCEPQTTLRNVIRKYIFEKQNKKCSICGMESFWNGKELHFILDHINGDASNNREENLRLICPNCDSQLSTFKSRNKNSARNQKRQHKELSS